MSTWALVPAKTFTRAKSRLAAVLEPPARVALARSLLEHVLSVLAKSSAIEHVVVVTDGDDVAGVARAHGASVLPDPAGGLGAIVDASLSTMRARGASHALVTMSDLPHLTVDDVSALVFALQKHERVIAPDRHDEGTNALGVALDRFTESSFGVVGSFALHRARAEAEARSVHVHRSEGLAFDVDSIDDLARLRALKGLETILVRRRARAGSGSARRL